MVTKNVHVGVTTQGRRRGIPLQSDIWLVRDFSYMYCGERHGHVMMQPRPLPFTINDGLTTFTGSTPPGAILTFLGSWILIQGPTAHK